MRTRVSVKKLQLWVKIILLGVFFLSGSVTAKGDTIDWQAPFFQDHALVGKIWDTHKNAWLSVEQFEHEAVRYDYILLGETHNNPDHHKLQVEIINSLLGAGKNPSVVMEMLSQNHWQGQPHRWSELAGLQKQAELLNKGWPWELYEPILASVVQSQLQLFAGNISREELHAWAAKGAVSYTHLTLPTKA